MPEVAKCPVCGSSEVIRQHESGDCHAETWTEFECFSCGDDAPTFRTIASWNRYAAAMELAKLRAEYMRECDNIGTEEQQELWDMISDANKRVLEVFK